MRIKFEDTIYDNQYLADKYSKHSDVNNLIEGVPFINFPFQVKDIAKEYKYLSWILIDHDSNPVVNFSWIHWLVANYEVEGVSTIVPESLYDNVSNLVRGNNSFSCPLANISDERIYLGYGGPTPPDQAHVYTLELFAHNKPLDLNDGFFYNDLLKALEHVEFDTTSAKLLARN